MNTIHIHPKKIGKRFQRAALYPLILGTIICTILTLSILYSKLIDWVSYIESTLESREKDHLLRLSISSSQKVSSILNNVFLIQKIYDLNFLQSVYSMIQNNTLQASESLSPSNLIDVQTYIENPKNYSDYIISVFPPNVMSQSKELQLFFVFMKVINNDVNNQIGVIFQNGTDFRYRGGNMTYILNVDPCGSLQDFDARCLQAYSNSSALVTENLSLYYQYNLTMMLKSDGLVFAYFLPDDLLFDSEVESLGYTSVVVDMQGERVFEYGLESLSKIFSKNLSQLLESNEFELLQPIQETLIPLFRNYSDYVELMGYNSEYMASFNEIDINGLNYSNGLISLNILNKRSALSTYYDFLDNIYNIIIAQVSIFLIFIAIGLITTYKLSLSIHSRISRPLSIIEAYLLGVIPRMPKLNVNKEINEINRYLLIIEIIEQILDPRFLLNPNTTQKLENLKEVDSLFQAVKNNKGLAIIKNLIGNIYLDEQEYDKAIDFYREALVEMETLYKEVVAQENAENTLSYEERKILRMKTGKEEQGWSQEKALISSNICQRIQQLCYAKQHSLENSLDSPAELRSEWKSILEFQTKALQYYISTSSNYIEMLKVIVDMAYVYHKLQYFHTALEMLEIAYGELSKISTEHNDSKSIIDTLDIDISRLKRLSVKVKDSEARKLYFQVSGITFEKDILKQQVLFRRGLIYLDNERYQEAALYFTMAIEQGTWYDPEIRKMSIEKIYMIFCKFKLMHDQPLLITLHEKMQMKKKSTIFCMCYDICNETGVNEMIVNFVSDEIQSQNENFGAITSDIGSKYVMEVVERDYPGLDIENLISSVVYQVSKNHIYDVIVEAIKKLPRNSIENLVVVILKGLHDHLGPARLEDIFEDQKFKIVFLALDDSIPDELNAYIARNGITIIQNNGNAKNSFEELRKKYFY